MQLSEHSDEGKIGRCIGTHYATSVREGPRFFSDLDGHIPDPRVMPTRIEGMREA